MLLVIRNLEGEVRWQEVRDRQEAGEPTRRRGGAVRLDERAPLAGEGAGPSWIELDSIGHHRLQTVLSAVSLRRLPCGPSGASQARSGGWRGVRQGWGG